MCNRIFSYAAIQIIEIFNRNGYKYRDLCNESDMEEEYCTPSFVIADEAISEILMKKTGGRLRNSFMMCCSDFTSFHSLPLFLPEFCKGFLCPTSL